MPLRNECPRPESAIGRIVEPNRVVVVVVLLLALPRFLAPEALALASPRFDRGDPAMNDPGRQPLLAFYYEQLDLDSDLDTFQSRVEARYSEGTLRRLVAADHVQARRGAVTALGLIGTFESNPLLGSALADEDPTVRRLASQSLWSVWFRAGTPEQNDRLQVITNLLNRGLAREARLLATRLIDEAPDFAEAVNQRAIASFNLGEFAESAADCQRVLELNPYHFGALGGLGQCYLRLGRSDLALDTFRRSLALQPHDEGLKRLVTALELDQP